MKIPIIYPHPTGDEINLIGTIDGSMLNFAFGVPYGRKRLSFEHEVSEIMYIRLMEDNE